MVPEPVVCMYAIVGSCETRANGLLESSVKGIYTQDLEGILVTELSLKYELKMIIRASHISGPHIPGSHREVLPF